MKECKFKVSDRIFYEIFDFDRVNRGVKVVGIGTAIVTKIIPSSYVDDNGKLVEFNFLDTGKYSRIEDYNCLPYDDPRVKEEMKKWEEHDKRAQELFEWVAEKWNLDYEEAPNYIRELLKGGDYDE